MDHAAQEALSVNGLQGVTNHLEIVSPEDLDPLINIQSIQSEQLEEAVYRELINNLGKDLAVTSITAVNGVVRLRGTVPSMYHSQRAESTSRNVVGVRRVDNQLTVDVKARADAEILYDVQFGLKSDAMLGPQELTVQVQQGAVTLSGEVQDFLTKSRAARIAGRVHGVRSINNEVKVAWSRRFSDDGLVKRIQERFAANGQTGPIRQHIRVRVEAGRVTLTGQVDHSLQRSEAERITLLTDGVRSVENRLTHP
jgi:osmotically-inducible protein OsmY